MTTARPVPFRAGRQEAVIGPRLIPEAFTGPAVLLADISEFQPSLFDALYLAWSKAIIIRAAYGDQHDDQAWFGGARRDALHKMGARFIGIYQYIVAGQDITAQANAMIRLVGKMRPGEILIADIEEGSGSQQARWVSWATTVHAALGFPPWDYSGAYFASSAGISPVTWVAAYGSSEPSTPHKLWQFTDAFNVPGLPGPVDCSVFHGSIGQLAALAYQGAQPPPLPPPVPGFPQPTYVEDAMLVLDLPASGPAVCLPVPAGKTRVLLYADPGYRGQTQPKLRIGFAPGALHEDDAVQPSWGKGAGIAVPPGATQFTLARLDAGSVPVTVDFA